LSSCPKHIRAKELGSGELYISLNDLRETLKEDVLEMFSSEAEIIATNNLLMLLNIVENFYSPRSTSLEGGLLSVSLLESSDNL